jgi:hypothetical protein
MVLGLTLGVPALAGAADAGVGNWHFTALLDGQRIGEHDFSVVQQGDEQVVETVAHFKVRTAFVTVYDYDHHDHEVWRQGCLASLNSRTDDNGHALAVHAERVSSGVVVQGAKGATALPDCVRTFAYWDPAILKQTRLLNSETGDYQPVSVTPEGPARVSVRGSAVSAQRYSLTAPGLALQLWYSSTGEWLALESKVKGGRTLRYEIQ